jgi:septal ring factor EnvC (AmiA/AmiB activator)
MTITPVGSSDLLLDLGEEFQQLSNDLDTVDQNAATVIAGLIQTVDTQAQIAKGKLIVQFREEHPALHRKWNQFLKLKGLAKNTVYRWENSYRCSEEVKDRIGDEQLKVFGASVLATLYSGLSTETRIRILESGSCTQREVNSLLADPQEKLNRAEEDHSIAVEKDAKAKKDLQEYSGPRSRNNPEFITVKKKAENSKGSLDKLEAKIAKLKEQIQLEQDKASAAEAAKDKAEEQLNQVMFDEDTSKDLQVKRVGYNLQNMVPQVLADSQRYLSERNRYSEDLRFHIDQQLTQLLTYLQTHYGN